MLSGAGRPLSAFEARKAAQKCRSSYEVQEQSCQGLLKENIRPTNLKEQQNDGSVFENEITKRPKVLERQPANMKKRARLSSEDYAVPQETGISLQSLPVLERFPASEIRSDSTFIHQTSLPKIAKNMHTIRTESTPQVRQRPKLLIKQLSNFSPSVNNYVEGELGDVTISLTDGETVTFIGQYELWVRKGSVSILGAVLHASSKLHRVFAPSTHVLPTIAHLRNPFGQFGKPAEIVVFPCWSGLRPLRSLSPKFGRIWNSSKGKDRKSFSVLRTSADDPLGRSLNSLEASAYWQSMAASLMESGQKSVPVVLVCGPTGTGKSTFSRYLSNAFISGTFASSGVACLEIDPGQPDCSLPGEVSLVHLREFNLGPPFTHPLVVDGTRNQSIRSHYLGTLSPLDDPYHYMQCAMDLFRYYRQVTSMQSPCPLIINCCGWILGNGLEILRDLITHFSPTDIVYMSATGPMDVMTVLRHSATTMRASLHFLDSGFSMSAPRVAVDARLMQTLSYFHLDGSEAGQLHWDSTPLYAREPMKLRYEGLQQDIMGIMLYGEELDPNVFLTVVDGSVLALVAVEDDSALPQNVATDFANENNDSIQNQAHQKQDEEGRDEETGDYNQSPSILLGSQKPYIRRTKEGLPYLFVGDGTCVPLDPTKTRCMGHVLVCMVSTQTKELLVVSPIRRDTIDSLRSQGTKLVLVRGKVDTPGWAYQEEYHAAMAARQDYMRWKKQCQKDGIIDQSDLDLPEPDFDEPDLDIHAWAAKTSWLELAEDNDHARRRGKVWKVRRNLETGDGRKERRANQGPG